MKIPVFVGKKTSKPTREEPYLKRERRTLLLPWRPSRYGKKTVGRGGGVQSPLLKGLLSYSQLKKESREGGGTEHTVVTHCVSFTLSISGARMSERPFYKGRN